MGSIFELIADTALEVLDDYYTECHVCEATDVALYCYNGQQYDAEGNQLDSSYIPTRCVPGVFRRGAWGVLAISSISILLKAIWPTGP